MKEIETELIKYMKEVEDFSKDTAQDSSALYEYMITLTNYMARANYLMAEYGRKYRLEKKLAYDGLSSWSKTMGNKFSPLLAKDYVDSQCAETGFVYDLAERLSRLCTHTIEALRSVLSGLKSEREFAKYN
jgi:hypothetical protein